MEIIGTVGAAFLELKRLLKDFLLHTYVKCKRSKYMKNLISGVNKSKYFFKLISLKMHLSLVRMKCSLHIGLMALLLCLQLMLGFLMV